MQCTGYEHRLWGLHQLGENEVLKSGRHRHAELFFICVFNILVLISVAHIYTNYK